MSQWNLGAVMKFGEKQEMTVGPGEQDHLLVITDADKSAKVEHAKRRNNKLKVGGRSRVKTGSK